MAPRLLAEMSWEQVEEYLQRDDRVIMVTGSTEQHGRHMGLATDTLVPYRIAERVSDKTGVPVAPPLGYGMSLHHLQFPGSLSLRPQTLVAVLTDLLEIAAGHGFRRILVLNGHGGNLPSIGAALNDVLNRISDLRVKLISWWTLPSVDEISKREWPGKLDGHAGPGETSAVLALLPRAVNLERAQYTSDEMVPGVLSRFTFRQMYPHGVIGSDPKLGSAAIGQALLDAAATACAAELETWAPVSGKPD